jgi:hypothetical protein
VPLAAAVCGVRTEPVFWFVVGGVLGWLQVRYRTMTSAQPSSHPLPALRLSLKPRPSVGIVIPSRNGCLRYELVRPAVSAVPGLTMATSSGRGP